MLARGGFLSFRLRLSSFKLPAQKLQAATWWFTLWQCSRSPAPVGRQFKRHFFKSCQNFVDSLLLSLRLIVHICHLNIWSEHQSRKRYFLDANPWPLPHHAQAVSCHANIIASYSSLETEVSVLFFNFGGRAGKVKCKWRGIDKKSGRQSALLGTKSVSLC